MTIYKITRDIGKPAHTTETIYVGCDYGAALVAYTKSEIEDGEGESWHDVRKTLWAQAEADEGDHPDDLEWVER